VGGEHALVGALRESGEYPRAVVICFDAAVVLNLREDRANFHGFVDRLSSWPSYNSRSSALARSFFLFFYFFFFRYSFFSQVQDHRPHRSKLPPHGVFLRFAQRANQRVFPAPRAPGLNLQ